MEFIETHTIEVILISETWLKSADRRSGIAAKVKQKITHWHIQYNKTRKHSCKHKSGKQPEKIK